ncbi:hypothetical protein GCM10022407_41550 [Hymenobacter antarcticus]|uniref:Secretion system C-terminal sorting domain-containing protein n=2 Tax=Hymenobacter antarcticus TaxID=486270 RepID=A0ABP7R7W1_9BACT
MAALLAPSLSVSAQFVVDGVATATEIGTGPGKYQLAAAYAGNHLDADRGLKALYVGSTATTLNLMLVGSAESTGGFRALILYLNTPARPGAAAGTALPGGSDGLSPLKHKPTMDMVVDYGFRVSVGATGGAATDVFFSNVSYVTGTAITAGTDAYVGQGSKAGAMVVAGATAPLPGTRYAYLNTASLTANTTNAGLEIEIPLAAFGPGVASGSRIDLFATYTDGAGIFYSETIPAIAGRTTTLGPDPNFAAIAGTQAIAFELGAGVLAARSAAPGTFAFGLYPNPAQATATVAYTVPGGRQAVSLAVYNALGQRVHTLPPTPQAGPQLVKLGSLPAGAYLVKLQIGDQYTSGKLVLE